MNQSILFDDAIHLDDESVHFKAQQQGMTIHCSISYARLSHISGLAVHAKNAQSVFNGYRFDIEELAENAIYAEAFDALGNIVLS